MSLNIFIVLFKYENDSNLKCFVQN